MLNFRGSLILQISNFRENGYILVHLLLFRLLLFSFVYCCFVYSAFLLLFASICMSLLKYQHFFMGLEVLGVFLQRGSALRWRVGQDTVGRTIPFGITQWCVLAHSPSLAPTRRVFRLKVKGLKTIQEKFSNNEYSVDKYFSALSNWVGFRKL